MNVHTFNNPAFVLRCVDTVRTGPNGEEVDHREYTVHHRLAFNEFDEEPIAAPAATPREAAALADAELARLAKRAEIQAATAAYLAGQDTAVETTVQPPQGWDSAEA